MVWVNNRYLYSKRWLVTIAENYSNIYGGLPTRNGTIINGFLLAEYKADFDTALDKLGKGRWQGKLNGNFNTYRPFGRLQQIIIADILKIEDYELEAYGFYDIPRLRGYAYSLMVRVLNGE